MTLQFRKRSSAADLQQTNGGTSFESSSADESNSVLVSSGIHRGRFPVGGMTVRAARQALTRLINIDPTAVPVINGQVVDEDTVLGAELGMLSFVKPSSLKG